MFVKLDDLPYWLRCERLSLTRLRILPYNPADEHTYEITSFQSELANGGEGCELRREDNGNVYAIMGQDGEHYCSCPDFAFDSGRNSRPCKHIAAVYELGILTTHLPIYLQLRKESEANVKPETDKQRAKRNKRITAEFA